MITAKELNEKTLESKMPKNPLERKRYQEILKEIEYKILERAKAGYSYVQLNTDFMYPFVDLVVRELKYNGYKAEINSKYDYSEYIEDYLIVEWQ